MHRSKEPRSGQIRNHREAGQRLRTVFHPLGFTMNAFLTETEKAVVDVGVAAAPVIIFVRAKQSLTVLCYHPGKRDGMN